MMPYALIRLCRRSVRSQSSGDRCHSRESTSTATPAPCHQASAMPRNVSSAAYRRALYVGLPAPTYNARLYAADETFLGIADAWWQGAGVAVEVDSREWHLSPEDWERTLRRHRRMSAYGIIVLHITPRQIHNEPVRILADLAAALEAGRSRPALAVRAVNTA